MQGRILRWAGGVVFAGAAVGLIIYFAVVGLNQANLVAGVIGVFLGLAGLALAAYGTIVPRPDRAPPNRGSGGTVGQASSTDPRSGTVKNIIKGSTIKGPVIQAWDADVTFGPATPGGPLSPPSAPNQPPEE